MRVSVAFALIRFLAILTSRKATRSVKMDVVETGMIQVLELRWGDDGKLKDVRVSRDISQVDFAVILMSVKRPGSEK